MKKGWLLGLMGLLMPISAYAQQSGVQSVLNVLDRQVGFLFYNFNLGDRAYLFYIKFAIFILLYAILYYAAGFALRDSHRGQRNKSIRNIIALVIALIGTIAMPTALVNSMMQIYGVVTAALLVGIPLFGLIWFNHQVLGGNNRAFFAFKAAIYYILALVITQIIGGVKGSGLVIIPNDFDQWAIFARSICIILMIWYIIRTMTPMRREGEEGAPEGGGSFWDRLMGRDPDPDSEAERRRRGGRPYPTHLSEFIRNLRTEVNQYRGYLLGNMLPVSNRLRTWRGTLNPAPPALHTVPAATNYTLPVGVPGSCWTFPVGGMNPMTELATYQASYAHMNGALMVAIQNTMHSILNDPDVGHLSRRESNELSAIMGEYGRLIGQFTQDRTQFQHDMRI